MQLKFGLRARFIVLFLVFSLMVSAASRYVTQRSYQTTIEEQYQKTAIEIANLAVSFLDGDKFEEYVLTGEPDADYADMQEALNLIRLNTDVSYLYALTPISENTLIYVFDTWTNEEQRAVSGKLGDEDVYNPELPGIALAMSSGETNKTFEKTSFTQFGYNATIYAPVKNHEGKSVGVVGVDIALSYMSETTDTAVANMSKVMFLIIAVCFIVLLIIIQTGFIHPIRVLKGCVKEMADGNLGVQAPVRGRNEISEISRVFNQMSFNIRVHLDEITDLNKGYYKFVPLKVFEILQKTDITQIRLGDYKESVLSVLSMQMNDFDRLSEKMETKELFAFINQVYLETVPGIQGKEGVIGEYNKGGFTAFYQGSCQEVLDSAIIVCQHFKETGIGARLAFGISYGPVMLGIVGNEDRLSVSMLSEHITASEYLKTVGWKYRSLILMTGSAAGQIPEFASRYRSRFIGLMHFKTSGRTEKLYDVYEGDSREDREYKDLTKEKFEEGVKQFLARQFYAARLCFIEVLKVYRLDYAAREYLYLCNRYYQVKEGTEDIQTFLEEC